MKRNQQMVGLVVLLLAGLSHSHDSATCGSPQRKPNEDEMASRIRPRIDAWKAAVREESLLTGRQPDVIIIPVYYNILRSDNGRYGDVDDAVVLAQHNVLNEDFSGTGFQFELMNITRSDRTEWSRFDGFAEGPDIDKDIKTELNKGGPETLNVYFSNIYDDSGGTIGYVRIFPWEYEEHPVSDGVTVDLRTLPGGSFELLNEGKTLSHEVGHWMGLYHVFNSWNQFINWFGLPSLFCIGTFLFGDDEVGDTPLQLTPTRAGTGCDSIFAKWKNTCILWPGLDSIYNPMDYNRDSCKKGFTAGQIERMREMYGAFRAASP